jgi:multimeric flavodoxin WrbA
VLGISSSPRKGGNTDLLLDEFLRGAAEAGGQTEKICLREYHIHPCTQCDFCITRGQCYQRDDMAGIYPKLLGTDCLALATPIYFMAHTAQAKLMIDRCQAFWAKRYRRHEPVAQTGRPRRGVLLAVGATHGPKVFAGTKVTTKWFLDALEIDFWADLCVEGVDEKGAIRQHPTALPEAYELGRRAVESYPNSAGTGV